jgi:cyclase
MDLYKRIIFCLYFKDSNFYLSRNFRLQKVGNLDWLIKNFRFGETSTFIDELIVILVKEDPKENDFCNFLEEIKNLKKKIFIPIILGGYVRNIDIVNKYFQFGADKVLINTACYENYLFIDKVSNIYGSQAITIMVDYRKDKDNFFLYSNCGKKREKITLENHLDNLNKGNSGEIILNSIDNDGNGAGLDCAIINKIKINFTKPLLLMGGAGKPDHFYLGLKNEKISGVITANLFNFLGTGLKEVRNFLIQKKINIANF